MTRIEEIAAREKAAMKGTGHYQDFVANAARDIRYLLAQLQDRDEKLAAAKAYLQRARPFKEFPIVSRAEVFRDHLINIDRILHPKGAE